MTLPFKDTAQDTGVRQCNIRHAHGHFAIEAQRKNDKYATLHGLFISRTDDGQIESIGDYTDGKKTGLWEYAQDTNNRRFVMYNNEGQELMTAASKLKLLDKLTQFMDEIEELGDFNDIYYNEVCTALKNFPYTSPSKPVSWVDELDKAELRFSL
jgi:hypothetical protein